MPDVFLSYSRDDQAIARRFATALERAGFSVWWDQTLIAGEAFDEATERALEGASAVVVLWSKKSVASRWVRAEATQANRTRHAGAGDDRALQAPHHVRADAHGGPHAVEGR